MSVNCESKRMFLLGIKGLGKKEFFFMLSSGISYHCTLMLYPFLWLNCSSTCSTLMFECVGVCQICLSGF